MSLGINENFKCLNKGSFLMRVELQFLGWDCGVVKIE